MSIASGFHPDPPSGTISTTSSETNMHLESRVADGATEDVTLFTEFDAIKVSAHELLLLADMLIAHERELRENLNRKDKP